MSSWSFVLVAAGAGSRLGGERKQFRSLGGLPLWRWSLRTLERLGPDGPDELICVLPPDRMELGGSFSLPLRAVPGGDVRAESSLRGVRAARGEVVLIHDAARPFASPGLIGRVLRATRRSGASIPVLPVADALKRANPDGGLEDVPREGLLRAQTPQGFLRAPLIEALDAYGSSARDEAEAWIALGGDVETVEGDPMNFKITEGSDWAMAEALAGDRRADRRVGHGYDVHPLVPGRPLVLGGLAVDSPLGLLGHSDADVLCHATSDALLGAAGEPDLGTLFPASDSRYAGADSGALLARIVDRVRLGGWRIVWVDATLVAQIPRLGGLVPRIRESLDRLLRGEEPRRVANLKVKSGEFCGSVGRGECMICHVVATLEREEEVPRL